MSKPLFWDNLIRLAQPRNPDEELYPQELREMENELVKTRRRHADMETSSLYVGFGLSGGGIRSATFALGLFQSLARLNLLKRIDFLSTVSGGGYFGSFLGRIFSRHLNTNGIPFVDSALKSDSDEMKWLRWGGQYLAPNGAGDLVMGGAVWFRNWIALVLTLALTLLTAFVFMNMIPPLFDRLPSTLHKWLVPVGNGKIWWSVWFRLAVVPFVLGVLPAAWAYWLVPRKARHILNGWAFAATLTAIISATIMFSRFRDSHCVADWLFTATIVTSVLAVLALFLYFVSRLIAGNWEEGGVRNFLSRFLTWMVVLTLLTAAVGILDSLGQTVYALWRVDELTEWLMGIFAAASAIAVAARRLTLATGMPDGKGGMASRIIIPVASVVLMIVFLVSLSAIAHGISWNWKATGWSACSEAGMVLIPMPACTQIVTATLFLLLTILIGRNLPLLNRSTSQPLYSARLIRSYLGASNPKRKLPENRSILQPITGDDTAWKSYKPFESGGPLHLVNVTLNETVHARTGIESRTRKGEGMAIGPCGISVGRRHHAQFQMDDDGQLFPISGRDRFHMFRAGRIDEQGETVINCEPITLGHWIGISGAAVSTGMGSRTSLFAAILLGLFNVRLGHWWDSGIRPWTQPYRSKPRIGRRLGSWFTRLFPVQSHLIDEILARFHGGNRRRWYLSDGGHFENLAGYELIRRRLPLILISDAECDPDYQFQGLATLVRKSRMDLAAEIRFLSHPELDKVLPESIRKWFGTPDDMKRLKEENGIPISTAHAAMAYVYYDGNDKQGSVLVYIKPTVMGDETRDILQYATTHPDFPQQTTADQFFDEPQWESYRKLGEIIGDRLFGDEANSKSPEL